MIVTNAEKNKIFHSNILNHILASGFCSKEFSLFESHNASVTPGDMNLKSEMRFNQLFSDSMSNFYWKFLKGFKLAGIDKLPV